MKKRRFVSVLLSTLIIISAFGGVTISAYDNDNLNKTENRIIDTPVETVVGETTNEKGETSAVTYKGGIYDGPYRGDKVRYYFAMPKEWRTFTNAKACAYWWDGTDKCSNWQHSYQMKSTSIEKPDGTKVYYIDVATDVRNIVFSNGIDVGTNDGESVSLNWGKSYQTDNISLEGYAPNESKVFPDGIDNFDNLVYVIDTDNTIINDKNGSVIYGGEWYYLHSNGNWDDKAGSKYKLDEIGVKLNKNSIKLNLTDKNTYSLKADIKNKRFDTKVKWTSSDEKVAKVDENGVVTAVGYGSATISVSAHNPGESFIKSDKCQVTVTKSAEKKTTVTLGKSSATLYVKGTTNIKATVKNGSGKTTYKSSNSSVAKVDSKGKVIALKAGKAQITVTNNKVSKTFTVTVKNPKLNKTTLALKVKNSFTIKITGKIGKATFTTSNKKIATVNSSGKVIAKKKGKAVITVKSNGIVMKCNVTVK